MTGPEAMHRDLTSGDPAAVAAVRSATRTRMTDVHEAMELIRFAADTPDWDSPSGRTRFNMSAWATRASAQVGFVRLNRAALALRYVHTGQITMRRDADEVIGRWRRDKELYADTLQFVIFRMLVMNALAGIRTTYEGVLTEAETFLIADELSAEQQEWYERGLARTLRWDLENPSGVGPQIPDALTTGDDGGFTTQGLGYDPESGYLLQVSYQGEQARLSVIDPDTGEHVGFVELAGYTDEDGTTYPPPDHGGGVSVHDGRVYVSSSANDDRGLPTRIYDYPLSEILRGAPGASIDPGQPQDVDAAAYSTIVDGTLYVGTFAEDGPGRLYTYTQGGDGEWTDRQGPFTTPAQTQGIAVRGNEVVFSTSYGRGNPGHLESYDLPTVLGATDGADLPDPIRSVALPTMAEGVVALPDGGVLTTYESGAEAYSGPKGDADLEDLWAAMNMTITPYSALGLADGGGSGQIDVVTDTLRQARASFVDAEAELDAIERGVRGIDLAASALGGVDGAAGFAAAVNDHLSTTATWLAESRLSAELNASGLVAAAEDYDDTDGGVGSLLDRLKELIP